MATSFRSFSEVPVVGETLLVGLDMPVPRCVVRLDVGAQVEGVGVRWLCPPYALYALFTPSTAHHHARPSPALALRPAPRPRSPPA